MPLRRIKQRAIQKWTQQTDGCNRARVWDMLDGTKSWRRKERRKEVWDINNALLYKYHSYHTSKTNEHELICMTCMENGANVDCLLMRKVPQLRYQYFMNIEQTKNRHRKQTRGNTFGGIVSEMRRSLGGAKISQGEAKCVRYQECTEYSMHTTSDASKQTGYSSVWNAWRMDVNVECLARRRKDWSLMLAGKGWSSRPIEYRMVSSFCRVAGYAERSGRQWSIRTNLMNQLGEC